MKEIDFKDIVQLHLQKFGVAPVITGIDAQESGDLDLKILYAIESGVPYIEQEIPEGVLT
jgi:hypothetical protein